MLDEMASAYGNRFLIAAAGVSLALLGLFIVLWILRHRAPSPFVRGGRNRQPRLQVLDAAAVDARRRLVLVRRDNIEHLIMIGGPTDIVIESGIGDERPYISVQAPQEQDSLPAPDRPAASLTPSVTQPQRIAPATNAAPAPRPAPAREEPVASAPRSAPSSPIAAKPVQPEPTPVVTPPPPVAAKPVHPEPVAVVPPAPQPAAPQAAPAPPTPAVDRLPEPGVEDVFEAARKRVLPMEPVEQPPASAVKPEPVRPAQPGSSEFEKFLEAEMSSHLDSVKAQQSAPRPIPTVLPPSPQTSAPSIAAAPVAPRPVPPPGPVAIPVSPQPGATAAKPPQPKEEPNLQTEIARIFGEMNPGRNE